MSRSLRGIVVRFPVASSKPTLPPGPQQECVSHRQSTPSDPRPRQAARRANLLLFRTALASPWALLSAGLHYADTMQPTSVSVPVPGYQRESDPASLRLAGRRPRTFSQALERPMMARIDRLDHLQGSPLWHLPLEGNGEESRRGSYGILRQMAEHHHPSSHREYAGNVAGDKARVTHVLLNPKNG